MKFSCFLWYTVFRFESNVGETRFLSTLVFFILARRDVPHCGRLDIFCFGDCEFVAARGDRGDRGIRGDRGDRRID